MKKTTVIAFVFLGIVVVVPLLLSAVEKTLRARNVRELYIDSLILHRSAPITRIVATDADSILYRGDMALDVEVVFTDHPEECGIAYPPDVISLSRSGGVVTFRIADEFARKVREGWKVTTRKDRRKSVAAVSVTEYDHVQTVDTVPDTLSVRQPDGTVRQHATLWGRSAPKSICVIITTTSRLAEVSLGRWKNLFLGAGSLPALRIRSVERIGFHGVCRVDSLDVWGCTMIDWGDAVVGNIALTCATPDKKEYYHGNKFSYGGGCRLGSITISGEGTVDDLVPAKFGHITLLPRGSQGLNVSVHASGEALRIK